MNRAHGRTWQEAFARGVQHGHSASALMPLRPDLYELQGTGIVGGPCCVVWGGDGSGAIDVPAARMCADCKHSLQTLDHRFVGSVPGCCVLTGWPLELWL
jgi:hypothetical protein